jgi:hypothetical protein
MVIFWIGARFPRSTWAASISCDTVLRSRMVVVAKLKGACMSFMESDIAQGSAVTYRCMPALCFTMSYHLDSFLRSIDCWLCLALTASQTAIRITSTGSHE